MNFLATQLGLTPSASSTANNSGTNPNTNIDRTSGIGFNSFSQTEIVNSISSDIKASSVLKFLRILQPLGIYDKDQESIKRGEKLSKVRDTQARIMLLDLVKEDNDINGKKRHSLDDHWSQPQSYGQNGLNGLTLNGSNYNDSFNNIIQQSGLTVNTKELAEHLWNGSPFTFPEMRAISWRLLFQIAPNNKERHDETLEKKRRDYHENLVRQYYAINSQNQNQQQNQNQNQQQNQNQNQNQNGANSNGQQQQQQFQNSLYSGNPNIPRNQDEYVDQEDAVLRRQIRVDLPRTCAGYLYDLFQTTQLQLLMERVLYIWAQRHPACSYVQGINDLLSIFVVMLMLEQQYFWSEYSTDYQNNIVSTVSSNNTLSTTAGGPSSGASVPNSTLTSTVTSTIDNSCTTTSDSTPNSQQSQGQSPACSQLSEVQVPNSPASGPSGSSSTYTRSLVNLTPDKVLKSIDIHLFSERQLKAVEADSYYCLCKLMSSVQDHYTQNQPGIKRMVRALRVLLLRTAPDLMSHFNNHGVELIHVVFRWFNCLFAREFSMDLSIRLWDTFVVELFTSPSTFNEFLVFFASTFLNHWRPQIVKLDFQETVMFLQKLPTTSWTLRDLDPLIAKCHVDRIIFRESAEKVEIERILVSEEED